MEKKVYEQLNEVLYKEVLPNGLKVYVLPKPGFHKTYGLFSTNYGSIDNEFGYVGDEPRRVPDGIAHFLEHKLFEKEDGDVFQLFGKQGASSNAFTSFTKTSYLFSATDNIEENLLTLIDFVQDPYFTKETVEKEKGIIGQEIQMYDDDPSWRQFFGILKNLYPKHPLHIDIAGTVESIADITAEDLYACYHTFYHPSNMTLFVVGNIDPEEMLTLIRDNQAAKSFAEIREIKRYFPEETAADIVPFSTVQMPVNRTKVVVGIKGFQENLPKEEVDLLRFRTSLNLLFQLLIGNTSKNYFSGDSDHPDEFSAAIEALLLNFNQDSEVSEENLVLLKKKMLGKYFQSLNSLEFIANQFTQDLFGDVTLFDVPSVIQSIQLEDVLHAGHQFIKKEAFSRFYLSPLEK
jgi:predicted Zn-dependent peptidase